MSVIGLIMCEGAACPIKGKCARYLPNKHSLDDPKPFKFFASPPYVRGACEHHLEKRDV